MNFPDYQQAVWIFLGPVFFFLLGLRVAYGFIAAFSKVFVDFGKWLREHF